MLHKNRKLFISRLFQNKFIKRYSALFINGVKAAKTFVYVTPYVDFPERIKQKQNLQEQLIKRKCNYDLDIAVNLWTVYEELKQRKVNLDFKKAETSEELSKLIKSDPNSDAIKKLKIETDLLKENIQKLKIPMWNAEEAAILEVLKIPNDLHPQTPDCENKIIHEYLTQPNNNKDHLKIGKELGTVNFKKNENYYLHGDAAVFELGAKFYFSNILKQNNFVQFSNADFVKSLVIEGCGKDHTDPDSTFILHHNEDSKVNMHNRLHLTGGASLYSFFAYHTKNVVHSKMLPLKYFTMGRQYSPSPIKEDCLFHVSQSSVVNIFGATRSAEELDRVLDELIGILKNTYNKLNCHFRINIIPANKLLMWESLRIAVEMYSTSLNSYIEVANVSLSGDFVSKRLMFNYIDNKQNKFPHIISGTVLNIPKLLGCYLEQDRDFVVPDQFLVKNWKI